MAAHLWRLIPPISASGIVQMAIDEWLLEQHCLGKELPCLRFYTWQPVAISLGYHQRSYPDSWNTLHWQGKPIDVVRRPSGGRAVLHQGDVTYSLVTSGYSGRRRDIYVQLCKFLVNGWQSLDVSLHFGANNHSYRRSHNCFGASTAADLVMDNGYKVIGNAQLYRNGCILQHGSIRLRPNPNLVQAVFGNPVSVPDLLSHIQFQDVVIALTAAAKRVFDVEFRKQPLSAKEQQTALAWAQQKKTR